MIQPRSAATLISSQVHYTKGGKPGYYPPIKGRVGGQIQFNLYDPFNWFPEQGAESKARGLKSEILNGRAARPPRLKLVSWCLRGDGVGRGAARD